MTRIFKVLKSDIFVHRGVIVFSVCFYATRISREISRFHAGLFRADGLSTDRGFLPLFLCLNLRGGLRKAFSRDGSQIFYQPWGSAHRNVLSVIRVFSEDMYFIFLLKF